jgi:hypothetical protein
MSVSEIPEKVRALLWAKSAGRCEFDNCNDPLWRDSVTQIEMNFAEVAHIIGDRPNGPRGNQILSQEYCNDISNLMLMCRNHHKMIDEIIETYPEQVLRQMKQTHEERIELLTELTPDKTSTVLVYTGRIGGFQPNINLRDTWLAMHNEGWYPASRLPIELGMFNCAIEDHEEDYWSLEVKNLERQFTQKISPLLCHGNERLHFSVFAFAPQPLLIKLGTLLSDIYPSEVYQLHREPSNWQWQPVPDNTDYHVNEPNSTFPLVALNISLSASIEKDRITKVFGSQNYSEWKLTVDSPNNDFLKSRNQLISFRHEFRQLLNQIKAKHGEKAEIHIFPAIPTSIAIEIGRIRQPKADLPYIVYDQNNKQGGFVRTLEIGEANNE